MRPPGSGLFFVFAVQPDRLPGFLSVSVSWIKHLWCPEIRGDYQEKKNDRKEAEKLLEGNV